MLPVASRGARIINQLPTPSTPTSGPTTRPQWRRHFIFTPSNQDFHSGLRGADSIHPSGLLRRLADLFLNLFLAMRRNPRLIVAAVHGRALGGGCGIATACDLILALEWAEFGYRESVSASLETKTTRPETWPWPAMGAWAR